MLGLLIVGYVATRTFFFFSETWIVPTVVTAADERVVALERELAAHQRTRDRLAAELAAAERTIRALTSPTGRSTPSRALTQATARRDELAGLLAHRDQLIAAARSSPYLRAAAGGAVMAVAPYGNLDHVGVGTTVHACKLQMVWCRRVGVVADVLPGDVTLEHPHRDQQLVGRMLELRLEDREAARAEVLFVGGAPLWL